MFISRKRSLSSTYASSKENSEIAVYCLHLVAFSLRPSSFLTAHTRSMFKSQNTSMLEPQVFARRVATVCLSLDTFFQAIGLLGEAESSRSSPSAIYAAYAPHPYAQLGFFVLGVMAQLLWLLKLYPVPIASVEAFEGQGCSSAPLLVTPPLSAPETPTMHNSVPPPPTSPTPSAKVETRSSEEVPLIEITPASAENSSESRKEDDEKVPGEEELVMSEPVQMRYLPHYVLSASCQVGWTLAWFMRHYDLCIIFVFINLFSQIYALFGTLKGSRNRRFPTTNVLTYVVVKVRIAIAVMCLWKTWGAVDIVPPPTLIEGATNCIFFIILSGASGPDPTLGLFLALILFSLGMGQHNNIEWHLTFNWSGVIVFLFAVIDWAGGVQIRKMMWPHVSESDDDDEDEP